MINSLAVRILLTFEFCQYTRLIYLLKKQKPIVHHSLYKKGVFPGRNLHYNL